MRFARVRMSRFMLLAALGLIGVRTAACGGDEITDEHHEDVDSIKLFDIGGQELNTVDLAPSETMRIRVRFYAEDGDEITGLEDEHDIALSFSPAGLATATAVGNEKFLLDVTASAEPGEGTLTIGYGHDGDTSEQSFGPYPVTVTS